MASDIDNTINFLTISHSLPFILLSAAFLPALAAAAFFPLASLIWSYIPHTVKDNICLRLILWCQHQTFLCEHVYNQTWKIWVDLSGL